ncbi:MAG TPA: hypothetical protein VGI10_04375 [Polyangiaceae bacterium]|jgi:hypothetical protein
MQTIDQEIAVTGQLNRTLSALRERAAVTAENSPERAAADAVHAGLLDGVAKLVASALEPTPPQRVVA